MKGHEGEKSYPRRGTKDHEGPLRSWRRLKKDPPKVAKGRKGFHEKAKRYPRRATKNGEGPLRGWRRLKKDPPKVGQGGPRRDSKGLEKTRKGSVKGHEERHYGKKEIHEGHSLQISDGIEFLAEATAMRPFRVDPSGGDGRGCARLWAGGTPALPGGLHPMTSSHPGHKIAEAYWCRLWLKEVHLSSGLFVSIRGSSSSTISRFSSNDPHGRAGARLAGKREFPKGCTSAF